MPKIINPTPYQRLCSLEALDTAWKKVYENGLKSDSEETRRDVSYFNETARKGINRISSQLSRWNLSKNLGFKFKDVKGIIVGKKQGKGGRPLAIAPVECRIVQRAILDILQSTPKIDKFRTAPGSYGALASKPGEEKGVKPAIEAVVRAINSGADWFYKSDIKSFFTQIPIKKVIDIISPFIGDKKFIEILHAAMNLEVKILGSMSEEERKFFDYSEIGSPQGCCLSPLFGNILLYEFDKSMNNIDVVCLRYLDDFIILGKGNDRVLAAFDKGNKILSDLGLEVYKFGALNKKAKFTSIDQGFEFLGIEIHKNSLRPNEDSRKALLRSVKAIMSETYQKKFNVTSHKIQRNSSLVRTLYYIDNKLRGWGNHYSFCNDSTIFGSIDGEIDKLLSSYLPSYPQICWRFAADRNDIKEARRILGVHLMSDSKKDPIKWTA